MEYPNRWTEEEYQRFKEYLKENVDLGYQKFSQKLIFTNYLILGIRVPILKKIAKEIFKTDWESFLAIKNKDSYEELLLESFVICSIKDFTVAKKYFNQYIKKIDNWALCDLTVAAFKIIKKNKDYFFSEVEKYISSRMPFTIRVGVVILNSYYVEEEYLSKIFQQIERIKSKDYYVKMAVSWLLSTCYIKYPEKTLTYLKETSIDIFTYNKTISKICDSHQVDVRQKNKLKKLRK